MTAKVDGGLANLFRSHVPGHWQRVETGSTAQGVPDANYCLEGCEGWVEFKQTHGWTVRFKTGQVAWLMRRARAGGRVWVGIRRWSGAVDDLWMVPGHYAEVLAAQGMQEVAIHSMITCGTVSGPRSWDWAAVRRILMLSPESPHATHGGG